MSRPLTVRKPNADELHQLHQRLEQPWQSWQRRRAEVLLLYAADRSASASAQVLQVHRNTVSTALREFARHGLSALSRPRKLGAPPRWSKKQIAALWRLADRRPTTLGLPFGRWSLAKLRADRIRERIVPAISREHLRRVLKKGGHPAPRPAQALQHRSQSASDPAPIADVVAPPPTRGHLGLLRCAADHGQGGGRPPLHPGQTLGAAAEPEDPGAVRPVLALRGQPWSRSLGLPPGQGGGGCLSLPAAGASVGSSADGADRLGPRSGASDQGEGDAADDAAVAVALDQHAQGEPGR